jgi:hypothetical protein
MITSGIAGKVPRRAWLLGRRGLDGSGQCVSAYEEETMTNDPNLRVQVDYESKTMDVRQSAIQSYLDCPRRFFWEYVEGLEPDYPAGTRPWATVDTGTAVHEALGAWYDGTGRDPLVAWRAWAEETFDGVIPEGCDADLIDTMVEGHLDDLAQDGADLGETTVGVEVPVVGSVTGLVDGWTVNVHGRVDRLIETDDGLRIIDDWKTVGPLAGALTHIQQLGRYAVMVRASTGWRADRVRVTGIRKVKRTKGGPFYSRDWLPLNEDAYASHATAMRDTLNAMVRDVGSGVYLYNVTTECGWKCRAQDICLAQQHGDDVEMIVDLHYRPKGQEGTQW